jgi:hypothetical protein
MGEKRDAYRIFVWKREGKRSVGRPTRRWDYIIKTDLQEIGSGVYTGLIRLMTGKVAGSYEHANETSDSVKCWESD